MDFSDKSPHRSFLAFPLLLLLLSGGETCLAAQSPPAGIPASLPSSSSDNQEHVSKRANVTYSRGVLTVVASNASLNQILHEIARQTGVKISGGVGDDRVFGTYGPAPTATILATLLDGTGSNMLIVQHATDASMELILTPRVGSATPPDPTAAARAEADDSQPEALEPVQSAAPSPPLQTPGNSRSPNRSGTGGVAVNPAATQPSSTSQELVFPQVDPSTPPSSATTTPTTPDPSSDTVKTPQQIFEQLQKLRQQQTQQPTPQ